MAERIQADNITNAIRANGLGFFQRPDGHALAFQTGAFTGFAFTAFRWDGSGETLLDKLVSFWSGYFWDTLGEQWLAGADGYPETQDDMNRAGWYGLEFHDRLSLVLLAVQEQYPEAFREAVDRHGVNEYFQYVRELGRDRDNTLIDSYDAFLATWKLDCIDSAERIAAARGRYPEGFTGPMRKRLCA